MLPCIHHNLKTLQLVGTIGVECDCHSQIVKVDKKLVEMAIVMVHSSAEDEDISYIELHEI
jgi:hypothetical protein